MENSHADDQAAAAHKETTNRLQGLINAATEVGDDTAFAEFERALAFHEGKPYRPRTLRDLARPFA